MTDRQAIKENLERAYQAKLAERAELIGIVREVAEDFAIPVSDLVGRDLRRWVTDVRHLAMARVYTEVEDASLADIANLFGGRDHTTILSAIRKFKSKGDAA
ncbi:helix-turn-helix domain-containing protein [Rhodovulum sp. FJ3]|uniref:helix-turn-helix domain-containing protein n=1 Tax=Rhodovulum sp. FJ3 TaxID=3079053 RepID=UPI00293DA805|nr:helix-turn-helix domain-containing protein [Rhodovulum sp. FJ3]MDV4167799.1 helix-turn-helix domain-containing protein [Rhodovulum sp. FJ3]